MRIAPMFRTMRVFEDCIAEIDRRLRKFDQWPLREVLGKMIGMLRKSEKPMGRDAEDLIYGESG